MTYILDDNNSQYLIDVGPEDVLQRPLQRWRLVWRGSRRLSERLELDSEWRAVADPEHPPAVISGSFFCRYLNTLKATVQIHWTAAR